MLAQSIAAADRSDTQVVHSYRQTRESAVLPLAGSEVDQEEVDMLLVQEVDLARLHCGRSIRRSSCSRMGSIAVVWYDHS